MTRGNLKIRGLKYSYRGDELNLNDVNIDISKGECVAIIGESGCGKSTLTRVINGLVPKFFAGKLFGEISIDTKDVKNMKSYELSKIVGNVFQDPRSQFFSNEVAGEIAFGLENIGISHEEIVSRVHMVSKKMDIEDLLSKDIYTLSYGMRQKVAICSAKVIEPDIYLFDEPSANLDFYATRLLSELIQKLKRDEKTIIIAEHRLSYLRAAVDRYILMEEGRVVREYKAKEIQAKRSENLNKMGLRSMNFFDISIDRMNNKKEIQACKLELFGVSKNFKGHEILKDISFKYDSNEIIGLVGENGAGKSTLAKIISGLIKEDSGKILMDGVQKKSKDRLGSIWYIQQDLDSQLFGENLVDELLIGIDIRNNKITEVEEILKKLGLYSLRDRHPSTLSVGQKQRLILGVSILRNAEIIILDEPTSGLDFKSMEMVSNLLIEQQKNGGRFIIISHDIEFIAKTCNRILKIEDGKITEDYYLENIKDLLRSMNALGDEDGYFE